MFCPNCGVQIPEGSKFCNRCGAAIGGAAPDTAQAEAQDGPRLIQDPSLPEGIFRDEQGAYHWIYRMHMLKNPTVPIMFTKAFGGIMGGVVLIMSLVHLFNGDPEYIPGTFLVFLAITGGFILLFMIIWLCMAAARGGWYIVEHMMDERKVVYLSTLEDKKKTRGWAIVGFFLAMASDDMTMAGNSVALAASERFDSTYTDVKSIQAVRRRDLIKVNNVLQRNTIYAYPHQYEFVWNYITSHCPNAKIKG